MRRCLVRRGENRGTLTPALSRREREFRAAQATEELTLLRTHNCGELREEHIGQEVTLCGWVDSYRDHKGILFIDLRDRYGKTQVAVGPESGAENQDVARTLRSEFVVSVQGKVA